ncbi:hypothetical protein DDR33_05745 [Pararcticibacter amylolyticus]|uniref:Uncharacterized protein n=1 Tax=Pararcticibacter amylolyticus TaxID=2173175 RepID=A0A2U2PKQ4_9SPHI|nr:hypothetical protein DDR33_05745 [Pararcticibacter amylolyticus]
MIESCIFIIRIKAWLWPRLFKCWSYGVYDDADGWFLKFYPYADLKRSKFREIKSTGELPKEIASVPFVFQARDDAGNSIASYRMEFWAGFMGLKQNKGTFNATLKSAGL